MAEGGRRQQSRAEQKPAMEQLLGAVVMIKQALETGSRTDWAGAVAHERTVEPERLPGLVRPTVAQPLPCDAAT